MSFSIKNLVRTHLLNLKPYSSAKDEYTGDKGIFLDANENPFGSATEANYNRYPDPYQRKIKEKLSVIKGCKIDQIFLGNGSDEPIDLLYRGFCESGKDNVVILPPTYGMYEVSANINNIELRTANLTNDFQLNVDEILAKVDQNTKIIWICSPNNPSGNLVKIEDIIKIIKAVNCFVVVDEAYIDFEPSQTLLPLINTYPNLIVLQTFSKAWGLAGLRIGMCFGNAELIYFVSKIKPPYNINIVTQQEVLKALNNEAKMKDFVELIKVEKEFLQQKLTDLQIVKHIYHSDANFLLVKFIDAKAVFDFLTKKEVILRDRSKVVLCEDCIRISVGTRIENETLLNQLANFMQ
jgi:histidinol-phosphate aminotransferase